MGLRFRKSIKLCKGLKLNLNKKSVGLSFGGKGAQVSLNSKGITTKTIGVPGTGLYYTSTSKVNSKKRNKPAKNGSGKGEPAVKTGGKKPIVIIIVILIVFCIGVAGLSEKEEEQQEAVSSTDTADINLE